MKLLIKGTVQGVGFRPFVYRLAKELNLHGYVKNRSDGVEICIEKSQKFLERLQKELPPLAKIDEIKIFNEKCQEYDDFYILKSKKSSKEAFISPDISICKECLDELFDKKNRRYLYPLINCTNCGPRYTIIKDLPYDRKNTSMDRFLMCKSCKNEYENPKSRFYHAQPISCFECGPKVRLKDFTQIEAIKEAAKLINEGKILAIKGIGGFHLVCKAKDGVVKRLRDKKRRKKKPFALMFKDIEEIEKFCFLNKKEKELILSKERPIVIVKKKKECFYEVAPDIDRLGVFLPYSPIYYLLFEFVEQPLVVTSANISEEPIIKDEERLKKFDFYDEMLFYDREIVRSCDDSVVVEVDKKTLFYRLSRGFAPKGFYKSKSLPPILAVGARQKNTISFGYKNMIMLSPHIGDIKNIESFEYFKKVIDDFKKIYDFKPEFIICDKHPGYETTQYAKSLGIKTFEVQHHLAHVYAAFAELELSNHPLKDEKFVSFSWDGTGYGDDKNVWGGEVFIDDKRVYHFDYFKIAGGERAIKDIKLIGYSLLKRYGFEVKDKLFNIAYEKDINSFYTSSVGRMFDAVAFYAGLCDYQYYEGYSGLLVERTYMEITDRYEYEIKDGKIKIDWKSLILDKKDLIPSKFLNTLADIIVDIAKKEKRAVLLTGGVFQNKTLLEITINRLKRENLRYFFPTKTPINDGGVSLGQLWWFIKNKLP